MKHLSSAILQPTANHMDEDAMRIANRAAGHSEQEIEAMLQELRTTRCIPRPEDVIPAMQRVIDEFKDCFDTNLQSLLLTPAAMKTIQLQMQLIADGHLSGGEHVTPISLPHLSACKPRSCTALPIFIVEI